MENQIKQTEQAESSSTVNGLFQRIIENTYYQPKKIVVKLSSPEMGVGVFATEDIAEGELVERCPMIQMGWKSNYLRDPQIFAYLYSNSQCPCDDCKRHGNSMYMVLGYGMLYNHQDKPNTKWVFNFKNLLGDVVAVKPIKAGEEIFVSYGPNYFKNRNKVTV
jgi:SET domain-containing protein